MDIIGFVNCCIKVLLEMKRELLNVRNIILDTTKSKNYYGPIIMGMRKEKRTSIKNMEIRYVTIYEPQILQ